MRPVAGHQQPAGQARLHDVKAGAGGRPGQLAHDHVDVAVEPAAQRSAVLELAPKRRRVHLPGRAGALHEGERGCQVHAEHQRGAQHALVADQSDLETVVAVDRGDQGNVAARSGKARDECGRPARGAPAPGRARPARSCCSRRRRSRPGRASSRRLSAAGGFGTGTVDPWSSERGMVSRHRSMNPGYWSVCSVTHAPGSDQPITAGVPVTRRRTPRRCAPAR